MQVFTTGQVAKICSVAPRTVSKWFDTGILKGYNLPGSKDRRIPRHYLEQFMEENKMPLEPLLNHVKPHKTNPLSTMENKLTNENKLELNKLEQAIMIAGIDGGQTTDEAIEKLHHKEKELNIHNPNIPAPR